MPPDTIWYFSDGKPGHDNQTRGLIQALQTHRALTICPVPLPKRWRWRLPNDLPAPTLLMGAGHATHLALLRAKQHWGGKTIVLMQPSLPKRWFDLCIIPAHDQPRPAANVLITQGVLNTVIPSPYPRNERGLILLGGISPHFTWDTAAVCQQITAILAAPPHWQWDLTTSRRTPREVLPQLPQHPRLHLHPYPQADSAWVAARLQQCHSVWVSPDSVSMVYEAVTAGAAVGLLALPGQRPTRVANGLKLLQQQHGITPFAAWEQGQALSPSPTPLFEAERCAHWIIQQWLP